ncbi:MAG: right-handed parallel beta-helix repeat-containing protein [Paracoccaceae bacterium]
MATYTRVIENLVLTSTLALDGPEWNNTLIRNLTIQNVQGDGIMLRNVENVRIENVTIRDVSGDGIKLSMTGSTTNVIIANSLIENTGGDGINAGHRASDGVDHIGLQILNNTIDTTGLAGSNTGLVHGMYIQSSDPRIEGNHILNSTDGNGISIRSSGVIRDNFIDTTYKSGISYFADHAAGTSNILLIEDNVVIASGNGDSRSDIDILGVSSGNLGNVVGTIIVRDNFLTAEGRDYVSISSNFSNLGGVIVNDNTFVPEATARLNNGTNLDDWLTGTAAADWMKGYLGNDRLDGGLGNDTLYGDAGDDVLSGGDGINHMYGGAGNDRYVANATDVIFDSSGYDTVEIFQDEGDLVLDLANFVGIESFELSANGKAEIVGSTAADTIQVTSRGAYIDGLGGNDMLTGGRYSDTLIGGTGNDTLFGGTTDTDLRDMIYGGDGNDSIDGAAGNDELNGGNGNDTVIGGLGSDTIIGNDGNDVLGGSGGSDMMFGNGGNDVLNGGFGYDRLNGGAGADSFFHAGVLDHGSDWVQDYNAAEGDVLTVGLAGATPAQFQVNFNTTPGAGAAGVGEAFVIYRPTGQILWALVDGGDDLVINLQIGGQVYDLLS